jgi:O-antigen/teichoic acid export membrane protein
MKIIEVLMVVVGFYLNSILPSLSRFFEKKETENAQKLLSFSAQFLFSLGLIIFIL